MSGDLELNKILGAGLATALVILGLREITDRLYETKPPAKAGYAIAVTETAGPAGPAAPAPPPDWGTVLPTADVAAGEAVFAKCKSCHTNVSGAQSPTGPNLFGVVGRTVASAAATGPAGFSYSDAMKAHAKEAPVWTYDELFKFIEAPQGMVAGSKMTFIGVKPAQDRINLIAYLRSQGSSGYAIPAPKPAAAASAPASAPASGPAASAPTGAASAPASAAKK
jgi:cytochrome c